VFEVPPGRFDVGPGSRSPQPLHLVCLQEERTLPFQFTGADPARRCRGLQGRNHPIDVLPEPGMDLHRYRRCGYPGVQDSRLEVLTDDHRDTRPDNRHPPGRKHLFRLTEHPHQLVVAAEDELVVCKRCCKDMHTVLLKEPGVFERAARRPVEDGHVDAEVPGGVKSRNDGTRPWLNVVHDLISRFLPRALSRPPA